MSDCRVIKIYDKHRASLPKNNRHYMVINWHEQAKWTELASADGLLGRKQAMIDGEARDFGRAVKI